MIKSNFREWDLDKVDDAFGTNQVWQMDILDEWLATPHEISSYEYTYLTYLRKKFDLGGDDWNEFELENKFISPLIVFADIDNVKFSYFLERELQADFNGYSLQGKVDGMIASGFRNPKKPYFCLHEYKKGTDPNGDPKGQVLIAMLVAQHLNNNEKPILGCFVIGKVWQFVALNKKEYCISKAYTCDTDDIFEIFKILKGLKKQTEILMQ